MKLGIVSDEVSRDLKTAAEWAKERGIHRFELRNVGENRLPDVTKDQLAEIKAMLDGYGMRVTGISPGTYKCTLHDPDFTAQPERLLRTMECADYLGTKKIISFGIKKEEGDTLDDAKRVLETLQIICQTGKDNGFVICLENEPGYYNGLPDEIEKVQKAVLPYGGMLNWDMGNLFMSGFSEYKEHYERFKPYIASVHMKDYRLEDGVCVPIGEGCIDWKGQINDLLNDNLRFQDEELDMNIETHCSPEYEQATKCYDYIKTVLGERLHEVL